jgi:putative membrane-bound dehydrogenase-like protein
MKFRLAAPAIVAFACAVCAADRPGKTYNFPIYKNNPPGKQLTGQFAPASTPALPPEESQKRFVVPPGFEVRLFAAEPEVVNPVAMTWDERGRLWVVELYEYPLGAKPGEKPRDRIKILEDTDGDGRADKVTVFADGFNLATGIALGNGGVYLGAAPNLYFLRDTNGDDAADTRDVLMTGFGMEDRHELLNSFTWGPDGWLYLTHGVFTRSRVKDAANPNDSGVEMNAAVARFNPRTKKFEVVADGTSNPWGVDFDRFGNAFVSACVIDHFFHMAPGGVYVRQGGTPGNPYTYELLPSIVDHKHFMAAYAGVDIYQGDQFPKEWLGEVLMGNIHQSAINHDHLTPHGSSFKASAREDFLTTSDAWFRPVSTQTGPDGAVWIMDWYDRYPCYQNANADPDGVDREHGRIWRVVYVGDQPGKPVPSRPAANMNLAKLNSLDLVKLLEHPNVWQRRMAQRLLSERRDLPGANTLHDDTPLHILMEKGATLEARLAALWTLHSSDLLEDEKLDIAAEDKEPAMRAWAARLTGERGYPLGDAIKRLTKLAKDSDPSVRLAVATAARQFVSGSLTVDTPPAVPVREVVTGPILSALWFSSYDAKDPLIPFMYWMALEPIVAFDPVHAIGFYKKDGAMPQMPLSGIILTKIMRRVCDLRDTEKLDASLAMLANLTESEAPTVLAALNGLIEGQRGKAIIPSPAAVEIIGRFARFSNTEVAARARELGALWGDAAALQGALKLADDVGASVEERVKAIQVVRQLKNDNTRAAMLKLIAQEKQERVLIEALRALGEIGGDGRVAEAMVKRWPDFPPAIRRAAAEVLTSRNNWSKVFLNAIEDKKIAASEIPTTVIRALFQAKDSSVRDLAMKAIGRFREPDADKLKLIAAKRKVVLSGLADFNAGREVMKKTCLVCHKFYGEGADVGPDLTGVGRSTLDALLHNVINPSEVVGKGYENVEVETKDGRSVSGRLVEDTDTHLKLLSSGPKEDVIAKPDIASRRVSELSVMPEGLEQMPDADFRNLIWYILNPPQQNRPMTPQLWKELTGEDMPANRSARSSDNDGESVALWNPEWRVVCPENENAPRKLVEYAGRRNVLMTYPFGNDQGAALERVVNVPAGRTTTLMFNVAAREQGEWKLRVLADERLLATQIIDDERWREIKVDLTRFAGKKITLRLENCDSGGGPASGYWSDPELRDLDTAVAIK